ncbi:MAG: ATP-binding protein [Moorellaceae bacterium]
MPVNGVDALLESVRAEYERRKGRRDQLLRLKAEREARLAEARRKAEMAEAAARVFYAASAAARESARVRMERAVTSALRAVFGPGVSFVIEVTDRRGRPEAEFYVVSEYGGDALKTPVLDARGGGVVDVASLALRAAVAAAVTPPGTPVVLDEPGKHLSEGYSRALGQLLKAIADETGRQFIVVTHDPRVAEAADRTFRVNLEGDMSMVRAV